MVIYVLFAAVLSASQQANYASFPCFTHHGRYSTQNGIVRTIWLIGTTRRIQVIEDLPKPVDDLVAPYSYLTSDEHSYIYGDFDLCPVAEDIPGHMRPARVTGARNLVVQDGAGHRPPFKLLSTWPTGPSSDAKSAPPPLVTSNGGFSARRLAAAPAIDGRQWIAVSAPSGDMSDRQEAPGRGFALNFRAVDGDTGDLERFHVVLSRPGQEPVRIDPQMAAWAYITPDSRYVLFEPLYALDVMAWRLYPLSDALGIPNYTSIDAISRDGRRLLVSRIEFAQDCHCEPEYYELVLPK